MAAFKSYTDAAEAALSDRWNGKVRAHFQIAADPAARARVLSGQLLIQPEINSNPRAGANGLIHDWVGAVYIPNSSIKRVIDVLENFDLHARFYPQVVRSHLIRKEAGEVTGYWRVQEKGQLLPAVFDIVQTVRYQQISEDLWVESSHADDIRAVEDQGSTREKILPIGEGLGLLWKLYSYWTLQQLKGGVLAECRSISLSRGIPGGMAWMVRPLIDSIPRESMESTLRNTLRASSE